MGSSWNSIEINWGGNSETCTQYYHPVYHLHTAIGRWLAIQESHGKNEEAIKTNVNNTIMLSDTYSLQGEDDGQFMKSKRSKMRSASKEMYTTQSCCISLTGCNV